MTIFKGKIISVDILSTVLPNGRSLEMEIVEHPGGSAIVAINEKQQVCLLKQYRCVFDEWIWELPAGKIDNKEPPIDTAKRELKEEAGVIGNRWEDLGYIISSPGVFTEKVYLYMTTELQQQEIQAEDDEVYELHWMDFYKALNMAKNGEICDAKSIAGLYRAASLLN